jgi:hypothetical protein
MLFIRQSHYDAVCLKAASNPPDDYQWNKLGSYCWRMQSVKALPYHRALQPNQSTRGVWLNMAIFALNLQPTKTKLFQPLFNS